MTNVNPLLLIKKIALYDDPQAYKELFLSYYHRLTEFARSITGTRESAEEVVSDVFLKVWINRKSLLKVANVHLYLYISTRNASINCLKKENRRATFSLDEVVVELRSLYLDPEQLMITAEMFRRIQRAISLLPPRCQLIFKLVKEDGLKYREVAELLELSVKTVENQMSIALAKIAGSIRFDPQKFLFF